MLEKDNHPAYKTAKENSDFQEGEKALSKNDLVSAGVTTKIEKIKRALCHAIDTDDEKLLEETLWEYYYQFSDSMSAYRQENQDQTDFQEENVEESNQKPENDNDILKELMENSGDKNAKNFQDLDLDFL